jgi:hypothetical protein
LKASHFLGCAFGVSLLTFSGCAPVRAPLTEPAEAAEPVVGEPAARGRLVPEGPSDPGLAWSSYGHAAGCAGFDPQNPLVIIVTEQQYLEHFCRSSTIAWERFRLVVYSEQKNRRRAFVETLVRDGSDLVLVLRRSTICEQLDFSYDVESVSALVPAGGERLRLFMADSPGPC